MYSIYSIIIIAIIIVTTIVIIIIAGWWFQTFFIFHFIYGMSSFPLTNSMIFQDGHIAPPTRL